jgi:putative endonuclease
MGSHNEFGKRGEQLAADYMVNQGFTILRRNYRYRKAEIDLIARKGNILAIVEVKSRSSEFFQNITDTVTKKKIRLMVLAADHFVVDNDLNVEVRFDIITILKVNGTFKIELVENAFYPF